MRTDIILPFTDWPNKILGAVWPLSGAGACVWNQRDEGREITGRPMEQAALKVASCFVSNSPDGVDFLKNRLKVPTGRIQLIPNSVRPLAVSHDASWWRKRLSIAPSAFLLTMAASLSSFKDHATLLEAWTSIRNVYPDAILVLAGKEHDRSREIREKAAGLDGIRFLGEVDDIGGILSASDLLVHSSYLEGIPNVVLEAMSAGLPIVATETSGTRLALGKNYPWLTAPRDAPAMADAIVGFAGNHELSQKVGAENRRRAASNFAPERVFRDWIKLIHGLLRGPSPTPVCTPDRKVKRSMLSVGPVWKGWSPSKRPW